VKALAAICASENFVRLMVHSVSWASHHNWNRPAPNGPEFWAQVNQLWRGHIDQGADFEPAETSGQFFEQVV
jgi:hypothetical protein